MKPLVILTGPTAVGKTDLSIDLAKRIHGEIISADSMQVYKKMNIGTAKIMPDEMQQVPHFLIDVLDPSEEFNVVRFKDMALSVMNDIYARGHIPMIVGGTGFYIQALLYDVEFEENDGDFCYRKELGELAEKYGNDYLHHMLSEVDPLSAERIHPNNRKRVIRALEYYKQTGGCISAHNDAEAAKSSPYCFAYFVLNDDRKKLYDNIDRRIDIMLENGLVDEVKGLLADGYTRDMVSMQGLGYKEIIDYLQGNTSFLDAVNILKRDTRHFAKRQLTWFKREKQVIWINKNELASREEILHVMLKELAKKGIIKG